ncbi:MAG: hypothetical protein J6Y39_04850 [Bacteroidaceae bacterium]|nr:hypothetical protein [Bacteroidaceae bacterium]
MTVQEHELIRQLETRVRQLLLQDKGLQEKYRALEEQIAARDKQIGELLFQNQELEKQYSTLKVAKMLELSDSDTRNARQRINHLMREVDKCIALLKA